MATKTFTYEALDSAGVLLKGKIESDSAEAAASTLADQRLVPLAVTGDGTGLQKDLKIPGLGGRTTLKDLAILSRQFASMTTSGLTLLRSLAILEDQTDQAEAQGGARPDPLRRAGRRAAVDRDGPAPGPLPAADGQHDQGRRGRRLPGRGAGPDRPDV